MAYVEISMNGQDVGRRTLSDEPLVVGRAPECDVAVRDILLSRRHCRIEPGPGGWYAIDLGSKNGTSLNGEPILQMRPLGHGDVLRLGRTKIVFHDGVGVELDEPPDRPASRPADPNEALAGTLSGFTFLERGEQEPVSEDMPAPRPHPKEPAAYEREEVYSLLASLASSSWDSIYAQARQPAVERPMPSSIDDEGPSRRSMRPRSPIDLSLQVTPGQAEADRIAANDPDRDPRAPAPGRDERQRKTLRWVAAVLWVGVGIVGVWKWALPGAGEQVVTAAPVARVVPVDLATKVLVPAGPGHLQLFPATIPTAPPAPPRVEPEAQAAAARTSVASDLLGIQLHPDRRDEGADDVWKSRAPLISAAVRAAVSVVPLTW